MGTNAFKQIVRTIQNKIPVSKGLIRRSRETEQGYLADIHNFELEDGTLKFRQGTRLMANMEDELWYDIQSFKFGNTELVMGINYKRELWGWLAKWPETSFKIWNTSPFRRTYQHIIKGNATTNGHFSFERGNKFYMLEDNFSVILVNDYAEIFRIMKNGCFRITADDDYADQREAIQDARDDDSLIKGRIYLDIKEATNKVFNERMYIGDEYIRRSHRITGETRFAWVNELNVVSELSDPIDIEGYRHVVVSNKSIVDYDKNAGGIKIKRYVNALDYASDDSLIYNKTKTGVEIGATAGTQWSPAIPFSGTSKSLVSVIIIKINNGVSVSATGVVTDIPSGIYATFVDTSDGSFISLTDDDYNYNAFQIRESAPNFVNKDDEAPPPYKNLVQTYYISPLDSIKSFPRIKKTDTSAGISLRGNSFKSDLYVGGKAYRHYINYKWDGKQLDSNLEFDNSLSSWWYKLETGSDSEIYEKEVLRSAIDMGVWGNNIDVNPRMVWNGTIYHSEVYIERRTFPSRDYLSKESIIGFEIPSSISEVTTQWQNVGYDCWNNLVSKTISIDSVNLMNGVVTSSDIVNPDTDIITTHTATELEQSRFAVWNGSHIQGISQRLFVNSQPEKEYIVYIAPETTVGGNQNLADSADPVVLPYNLKPSFCPVMTLDYTGLRRIPMPLPMIRRAMRNPQHLTTAGGKVYAVEDNKIWVGSVDDFMMIDYIEIHSAVDHIASMDTGIVASTRQGLFYVASGEGIKRVIGGEMIMSKFLAPCSGGVLSVDGRDIHIVYKQVTDSGAWYPSVAKINNALTEVNLEGEIKSVSIGDMIYIADDWNVWIYDMADKVWAGKKHYKNRIHRLFAYKNKLGVAFETGVDRRNSFNDELNSFNDELEQKS